VLSFLSEAQEHQTVNRRDFTALLDGAAAAWPLAARAQQPAKLPTIGYLGPSTLSAMSQWTASFVQRLRELGWVEGRNVAIEYRWAEGRAERPAEIAAEFVRLKVDVIVTYSTLPVIAAKQATSVIPIVFAAANDPVGTGLVASLARPGGNVTGLSVQQYDLAGKRLELLREAVPGLRRLAIMANVSNPGPVLEMGEVEAAARALGLEATTFKIRRAESHNNQPRSHSHFSHGGAAGDDLQFPRVCRNGRSDVLWTKLLGPVPARCRSGR
jgi:putative ABC transport system substrate-binding protein